MKVIKRNGNMVLFDINKIKNAISKAMKETEMGIDNNIIDSIALSIEDYCNEIDSITVEQIQDLVEELLMISSRTDVAKCYVKYRYQRALSREKNEKLFKELKKILEVGETENSNANIDEKTFSGRDSKCSDMIMKEVALSEFMSEETANAHTDGLLYEHDLNFYAVGSHNCINADIKRLLGNGFTTKNGDVRPANCLSTACQLIAVIFQIQSQCQFGGVGACMIDYDLVPYVKKSFSKHLKIGIKYLYGLELVLPREISLRDEYYCKQYPLAFNYAVEMMEAEGKQSMQALFHNLNTLESRAGSQVSNVA